MTLTEKMTNYTDDYPVGTYTINATYLPYSNSVPINMTRNRVVTLTLEGFVIPEFPSFLILPLFMVITLLGAAIGKRKNQAAE
jgi:hypothetical protein